MSRELKRAPSKKGGVRARYPWDYWQDGDSHTVTQGIDFESPTKNFRILLHTQGRKSGMRVETTIKGDEVTFQFFDTTKERVTGALNLFLSDPELTAAIDAVVLALRS